MTITLIEPKGLAAVTSEIMAYNKKVATMFNDIFVDQLISDGRIIKIGGGELATDDHYVVEILDNQGQVLSRATGYELEKVFVEAFQATPPRQRRKGSD